MHAIQRIPDETLAAAVSVLTSLLRLPEVCRKTGCGTSKVYAMIAEGTFPKPVKVGTRSLWVEREIDTWIIEQVAKRDQAVAA